MNKKIILIFLISIFFITSIFNASANQQNIKYKEKSEPITNQKISSTSGLISCRSVRGFYSGWPWNGLLIKGGPGWDFFIIVKSGSIRVDGTTYGAPVEVKCNYFIGIGRCNPPAPVGSGDGWIYNLQGKGFGITIK